MLPFFQKIAHFILYGNSCRLGKLENLCLATWQNSLSPNMKTAVIQQLTVLTFVQRQLGGRLLVFSCPCPVTRQKNNSLRLDMKGEACLALLSLKVDGVSMKAEIWAVDGLFHSIQYSRVPPKHYSDITIIGCKTGLTGAASCVMPPDYEALYAIKDILAAKGIEMLPKGVNSVPIAESWYSVLCQVDDEY